MALAPGTWIAAAAPIVALFALVASGRAKTRTAAVIVAALSVVLAAAVFGSGPEVLAVALGKGLWLGVWILAVVWPAMLLYQLAGRAGLDRIGGLFSDLFPNPREKLLVLAWLLPSFVQGVAGFGASIIVTVPLLVAAGWGKVRAVAYLLVGYHWSVTFGSMGASFYVAALTAHQGPAATEDFARSAAFILGVSALLAGALVLVLDGGLRALRQGSRVLLLAGSLLAATLYLVAPVVPAIGTLAAGGVGLAAAFVLSGFDRLRQPSVTVAADGPRTEPAGDARPSSTDRRAAWAVAPYVYLVATALAVLLVPAARRWTGTHFVLAPGFPATSTARGWRNPPVSAYTPMELFGHPGTYLLVACALGYVTYRLAGLWPRGGGRGLRRDWLGSVRDTSISILALTCVATVLGDAGMMVTLARGLAAVAGYGYPYVAALVGALGSFLTGVSASSNALFAPLQAHVAQLIGAPEPVLLAAQVAGANIGNSVAPLVVLIGLGAVGAKERPAQVARIVGLPALLLLAVATGLTLLLLTTGWIVH